MQKLQEERLFPPVAETLHMVHVMVQAVKGSLLGQTGVNQSPWKSNMFHVVDEQCQTRCLHFFLCIEYQDGTRKAANQDYHGLGFVRPEDVEQRS